MTESVRDRVVATLSGSTYIPYDESLPNFYVYADALAAAGLLVVEGAVTDRVQDRVAEVLHKSPITVDDLSIPLSDGSHRITTKGAKRLAELIASTGLLARDPAPGMDLRDTGLLWLINRQVFHPRGFALAVDSEGGGLSLLGDGVEPWNFEDGTETDTLAKVERLFAEQRKIPALKEAP